MIKSQPRYTYSTKAKVIKAYVDGISPKDMQFKGASPSERSIYRWRQQITGSLYNRRSLRERRNITNYVIRHGTAAAAKRYEATVRWVS